MYVNNMVYVMDIMLLSVEILFCLKKNPFLYLFVEKCSYICHR